MIARPLTDLSDDELVARFRSGDDAPFDEIHRRYRGPLHRLRAAHAQGTGHDADDVVQDAFIRAYRGLRVTDRPMALRPWLYMIVRNRALDELRSPQRAGAYDDEFALNAVPTTDAAQCVQERDEMRRLVAEIARLPERQRMALVMREFDGCSHVETARRLQHDRARDEVADHPRALEPRRGGARGLTRARRGAARRSRTVDVTQIEDALGRLEEGLSEARAAAELLREGDVTRGRRSQRGGRRDGARDRRAEGPHERRYRVARPHAAAHAVERSRLQARAPRSRRGRAARHQKGRRMQSARERAGHRAMRERDG